jgi:multiple sugar transport system ATP-binding protein
MNFLPVTVAAATGVATEAAAITVHLPGGGAFALPHTGAQPTPGTTLLLGIRPEHLRLAADASAGVVPLRVEQVEHLGGHSLIYGTVAEADGARTTAHIDGQTTVRAGDTVKVALPVASCHLFAADEAGLAL